KRVTELWQPNTKAPAPEVAAAGLLTESGSRRKRKLNYSSAFAYELISQLRSISSCCGAVHSMVGSFGAWCDEDRIARLADKYIGEIRYEGKEPQYAGSCGYKRRDEHAAVEWSGKITQRHRDRRGARRILGREGSGLIRGARICARGRKIGEDETKAT